MNKNLTYKLLLALPVGLLLASLLLGPSCANTTQAPTGGKKDTIPPYIVGISPLPGATEVNRKNLRIRFSFNEYIQVKDPKGIMISPPLEKRPKYKVRGKDLLISFESDLDSNRTYTLDLTGAVADNNEGNMFPGYTLVFSTGKHIDSMAVTGTVLDCRTLNPVKGATVLLYHDLADSAVMHHRPDAAVKTDDWGFFSLRGIRDSAYRIYAITDDAGNNIYDPDADKIAFLDSVFMPVLKAVDTLPELLKYDMKDTLNCQARRSIHELLLFRDQSSKQSVANYDRPYDRKAHVTFMAPDVKIDSLWVRGIPSSRLILQMSPQKDSLEIWINDRRRPLDTLHLFLDYLKTDTLGQLSPFTEHLKLPRKGGRYRKPSPKDIKHDDTICVMSVKAEPENVLQDGFVISFNYPPINAPFDSLIMRSINPRQQEAEVKFRTSRDSTDLRRYYVRPEETIRPGFEYRLKVPHRKFRDINGWWNDSTETKVSLPNDDALSSITLELTDVRSKYIIDLLNEKRDKVLKTRVIEADGSIVFPYLKAGKYSIRITEDANRNGMVDMGNLMQRKMPEQVKFVKMRDGSGTIEIKASMDLVQSLNLANIFRR